MAEFSLPPVTIRLSFCGMSLPANRWARLSKAMIHPCMNVAFSPDGKTLRSAGMNGIMILWDVGTHERLGSLDHGGTPSPVTARFSPDGSGAGLGQAGRHPGALGRAHETGARTSSHRRSSRDNGLAFSPDGKTFASINIFGTVVLWDVATRRPVGSPFTASSAGTNRIRFSPDGRVLAVLGMDNKVTFWDVATRRPARPAPRRRKRSSFEQGLRDGGLARRTMASCSTT